ncbi:MAG: VOC family protein [Peptostreptococcaceae bacterium]|nr:VOC family protein [Peptostreptococcaceae bacterium]
MHHIEIYVSDLNKSKAFYKELFEFLEFEIYQEWEEGFSYIKDGFYIVFVQTKEKYLSNGYNRCNIGLNHLAFKCNSKKKIDELREVLIKKGVSLLYDEKFPFAGGNDYYALYFEDPDRIKLEIAYSKE